jgi:hypothetical protein
MGPIFPPCGWPMTASAWMQHGNPGEGGLGSVIVKQLANQFAGAPSL